MKIAFVIPAHNEEKTVSWVVEKTKKYGTPVVIDDFSSDRTAEFARKSGAVVVKHKKNMGLGSALRSGFEKALEMKADVIITIDADGQHDPEDIPKFIEKIKQGYDFVLGERNLSRYPFIKQVGNFFLNKATNFVSGTRLKDTESGFRAFRREALKKIYLKAERYEIAVEIIFEAGRNKLRTANVPINSRVYVKGVGVWDGVKNFIFLLRRTKKSWKGRAQDFRYVLTRRN
jgi:glycosyltransferase involved in cell wall biosynthesis